MKKVFLDANIVIDALIEEGEDMYNALKILSLVDEGRIFAYCSALSLGTVSYFMDKKKIDSQEIIRQLNIFCGYCTPTRVDATVVRQALDSAFTDFEDALQYFSAMTEKTDMIITRNGKDFKHATIPIYTPVQFLEMMKKEINRM